MTFATDLAQIPFTARGTDPAGFLPPILAASSHILFAMAASTTLEGDNPVCTPEELLNELVEARTHWGVVNANDALSATTAQAVKNLGDAIVSACDEFADWEPRAKVDNLRELANRVRGLGAVLDRELVALTNSDPGYAL